MLISVKMQAKILGIRPSGIVHVGAHHAEEYEDYKLHGWGPTIWIDALDENLRKARSLSKGQTDLWIQALVWSENDVELDFKIATNGQSSSVLEFSTHSDHYPEIKVQNVIKMKTTRLDRILINHPGYNFLNLDIQGAELAALVGMGDIIRKFDFIYTEVNEEELYKSIPKVNEIDEFLKSRNFKRVLTHWTQDGWGDALYLRTDLMTFWMRTKVQASRVILILLRFLNERLKARNLNLNR